MDEKQQRMAEETSDNGLPNGGEPLPEQKKTLAFKVKQFLSKHANILQIVKFTLKSLIAFVAEFASMYALQYGLKDI